MKKDKISNNETIQRINIDRTRTNVLKRIEQIVIVYLVQRVPDCISSNMLTFFGFFGNILVALSFVLASYFNYLYLLLSIVGFIINWIGDSLDGRIAYYRNNPRKWFGFSLDVIVDWIGIFLIGLGVMVYAEASFKYVGFIFIALYGWQIIIAQLKYKISNEYSIDSSSGLGPTEARIILSLIIILEIFIRYSLFYITSVICLLLLVLNIIDTYRLLKIADERDIKEREER